MLDRLPHRPPFRFLSEILQIEPGVGGRAAWRVEGTESFFSGHFPGMPVVPGVLITEAMAQLAGLVAFEQHPDTDARTSNAPALLAHMDIRLRRPVTPPATIELAAKLTRTLGSLIQADVQATVAGQPVATGSITLSRTSD